MPKPGGVDPRFEAELRRGVVQLVALHYLATPRYGYDLVRLLAEAGFRIEEGTLYPILRRFEKQGILTSRWDTAGTRPRKYYELSDEGRATKAAMLAAWLAARDATDAALRRSMGKDGEAGADPLDSDPARGSPEAGSPEAGSPEAGSPAPGSKEDE